MLRPGRTCPLSYRYGPQALRARPTLEVDTLWIAGGLYGNRYALEALLEEFDRDSGRKALVFNGDFHWFDAEPAEFAHINRTVLGFVATRGNIETEIAAPAADAGCGCAYPDWVGQETVDRSNRIIERLRGAASDLQALARLPMHLVARVGARRIGVVHGDADSLAGWNFSQEVLATEQGLRSAQAAFAAAGADVFASSHTCLPVLQEFPHGRVLVNNGAAGMPNLRGELYGLATRIGLLPARESVYGVGCGELFIDAVALHYDQTAWQRRFVELWPPGSEAHASYYDRIVNGPAYDAGSARRLLRVPAWHEA
jgi:hypothetical protein